MFFVFLWVIDVRGGDRSTSLEEETCVAFMALTLNGDLGGLDFKSLNLETWDLCRMIGLCDLEFES
jgi:hypothetical protein